MDQNKVRQNTCGQLAGAEKERDIRSVEADLVVPAMSINAPSAGRRVRHVTTGWEQTAIYHALYLPTDWRGDAKWPIIIEWPGNGNFANSFGDEYNGRPESCNLSYGVTAGAGAIWVSAPFVDAAASGITEKWWGNSPDYSPQPTLDYVWATIREVCEQFGGDAKRVVLAGFSRGSLAVNRLGLHDDETAQLWRAFICYSHYDGVQTTWPYPEADRQSAGIRLARLAGRPQFICSEGEKVDETRRYLLNKEGNFTFSGTGFRNHNDAWILRPSAARTQLREWFHRVIA